MKISGSDAQLSKLPFDACSTYVTRTCGQQVKSKIERHCSDCEECKIKLDIVLHLCIAELSGKDQQMLEAHSEALRKGVMLLLRLYSAVMAWVDESDCLVYPDDIT